MKKEQSIKQIIERLRSSPYIQEKQFGDISSFNFTRKAFINSHWNDLTMRARGLFINTRTNEIVARGYDKFFNVDERPNTNLKFMKRHMRFPAYAYLKENGFLGLIGYDRECDNLFFASKSMVDGEYACNLKQIFFASGADVGRTKEFLRKNNATIVVEVIDPINDPHIIEYQEAHVVLLDVIKNTWQFDKYPYDTICNLADWIHVSHKELKRVLINPTELDGILECEEQIEGYVIEDSDGFMVKAKTPYYRTWKQYRWKVQKILHNGYREETDPFLEWVYQRFTSGEQLESKSIIDLRNEYGSI